MLIHCLLKRSKVFILIALSLGSLNTLAREGGTSGGGGDASEIRVNDIRSDILKWIGQGGHLGLKFPGEMTAESYQSAMNEILAPHAVVVGFVTSEQEKNTTDPELQVTVAGQPKTCRGFQSKKDALLHILCNVERFAATSDAAQYRLIHHEYAGLAGVEQNIGASSDYVLSDQLTGYLAPETVLRLSIKKDGCENGSCSNESTFNVTQVTITVNDAVIESCAQSLVVNPRGGFSCDLYTLTSSQRILTEDFHARIIRPLNFRSGSIFPYGGGCQIYGGFEPTGQGTSAVRIIFALPNGNVDQARECARQALRDVWVYQKSFTLMYR